MIDLTKYIGKKFKHGGRGPEEYDCFGLVKSIGEELGHSIPECEVGNEMQLMHDAIVQGIDYFEALESSEEGCLILFSLIPGSGWSTHIGMMIDNYRFIHVMEKSQVSVERIDSVLWRNRIKGFYKWKTIA